VRVAEAAQHAAGNQVRTGLVYAAGGHAVMSCLDDYANTLRLDDIVDGVGDLRRHLFLDLQALGINIYHPGRLWNEPSCFCLILAGTLRSSNFR
jgi:hypothetical protein